MGCPLFFDFIAAITSHIPDKSFQLVRYYGWYSKRMRGQRDKQAAEEADTLLCPKCQKEMRIVSLIDDQAVIERILRHLGLWQQGVRVMPSRAPPANETISEPWLDDPFPDYDTEPVMMYANA